MIFDCDGVLVNSEPISNRVLAQALGGVGLSITTEDSIREFMGRDRRHMEARAAELLGRPLPHGFYDGYAATRDAAFEHELRAVEGIATAVDAIGASGAATCVASSAGHAKLRLTLGMTGLYNRFEGRIFSATEVAHGKPAPDLFLHAAARMRFEPHDCVVVEDAPAGVTAGVAAGMRVLGYAALTAPQLLADAGTDATFADMAQLPELVAGG